MLTKSVYIVLTYVDIQYPLQYILVQNNNFLSSVLFRYIKTMHSFGIVEIGCSVEHLHTLDGDLMTLFSLSCGISDVPLFSLLFTQQYISNTSKTLHTVGNLFKIKSSACINNIRHPDHFDLSSGLKPSHVVS